MLRIVISVILIIISCVWMFMGINEYGMWIPGVSADTGFIPTVFGAIVLLFSVVKLVKDIKAYVASRQGEAAVEKSAISFKDVLVKLKPLLPAVTAILAILLIKFLGMVIGTYLALFFYMKVVNNDKWVKSLWVTAVITLFFYAVFVLWLKVPFPRGIFGI
ncbi:MAG: tripartite tricarboxylate transporter TctB family protein [Spirochaetales bacterium]|nr:tripartite tricarboxylate transporter TctB family protein [Spirochaetales bacterium]MBQ3697628.1 tripartite tricarboxylate transporter TctB family protein [Spirochaetales bacterium]MBQ4501970.1 tripartite tricarboxylate transporter TctB family protein [Spirochaetales bacterium]MBQ7281430.1 tripartite tricarboxylate transporter TctB family protein [Spirochaetales bacterium]MBQ7729774.1 tripartite tricarboxylate transporter TctB family protein [Spirochaetales bacterium]